MRVSEIFALTWGDILYDESLIAVRSMLKGGRFRYVPLTPELAAEYRHFPSVLGDERVLRRSRVQKGTGAVVRSTLRTVPAMAQGPRSHRLSDCRMS